LSRPVPAMLLMWAANAVNLAVLLRLVPGAASTGSAVVALVGAAA